MDILYFVDLETTTGGGPKGDSPEAHWDSNQVILCGWAKGNGPVTIKHHATTLLGDMFRCAEGGDTPIIVAHNAKFDIKYLLRRYPNHKLWSQVKVWDTMTFEYMHSGHEQKFMSLENTAKVHGIPFKKSLDLGALLASGVTMTDIPIADLTAYLIADVQILRKIYYTQRVLGDYDMRYIVPLAHMENHGLYVDSKLWHKTFVKHSNTIMAEERVMHMHIQSTCEWQNGDAVLLEDFTDTLGLKSKYVKAFSRRTLSFLLTGVPRTLPITAKWNLRRKPGEAPLYGYTTLSHPARFKGATNLGYVMDDAVLEQEPSWIGKCVQRHRHSSKLVGTYLTPFWESMHHQRDHVYPKLNTTATNTGRLSSSNPNGQNIPGEVRNLITSNLSNAVYEIDFKQLEMVAVACVSRCKHMITALNQGQDLHYLSGKTVFGWTSPSDMTDQDRKIVKAVNFGVLYGGKATGLAKSTGVAKAKVQKIIDSFYRTYPGVGLWQERMFTDVVDNMYPHSIKEGIQRYASDYKLPLSNRKFRFIEGAAPPWVARKTGRPFSFSPTHTSNYPIQGFAGGDICMYALWVLFKSNPKFTFIITVHDSIIIESDEDISIIQTAVDAMCQETQAHFNIPVALHCDVRGGTHWS